MKENLQLNNKVAIVTGATSGIGAEISRLFVSEGAKLVLVARKLEPGKKMEEELGKENAVFVQGDVAEANTAKLAIDTAYKTFNRLDVLINNAAIDYTNLVIESPLEDVKKVFDINFFGSFIMLKECALAMKNRKKNGAIVNLTSRNGTVGVPTMGVYGATKSAMQGLTRTAAIELAQDNIRVNAVAPGLTKTPLIDSWVGSQEDPEKFEKSIVLDTPQLRMAQPKEIANAVMFLASDDASHITGEQLAVDGGYTAR